ncbi:hypothetical protein CN378_04085 [Bacillus sp. AFS015802]|uniref:hypothetical protein n=1 Tax=Bacillus sp. AFS015802 TaxID=2033486 RepID=UPI000BF758C8|nr:hypothetical protein [Bacillus sp. AFS015802]PFA69370.1 hypothetical protein CN378_04085 [Bacillus sp. AFS015802]
MSESEILEQLQLLRTKEVEEIRVLKEDFLAFRSVLVKQDDFKQFRGIAQQGGNVLFRYLDTPRS